MKSINFKMQPETRRRVDAMLEIFKTRARGETITHAEIETATGVVKGSSAWPNLIEHLRKHAASLKGVVLQSSRGIGYRLAEASEQISIIPADRMARARRQIRRGQKAIILTPQEELKEHEQKTAATMLGHLVNQEEAIGRPAKLLALAVAGNK